MPDDSVKNPRNPQASPTADAVQTPQAPKPNEEPNPAIETPLIPTPETPPAQNPTAEEPVKETPADGPDFVEQKPSSESTPPAPGKKNIFIAGGILALLLVVMGAATYFTFYKNIGYQQPPEPSVVAASPLPKATLAVNSPNDEEATITGQITVSGKATPNSLVTVTSDNNEETFETDAEGNFSGTFALDEGPNEITITAFGDSNEENSETRSVVYVREEEL